MTRTKLAALILCLLMSAPSNAQERGIELGSLDCAIDAGTGFIFGSSKNLRCTFTPADQEFTPETYVGNVAKYGLDIGAPKQTQMRWLVLGPSNNIYAPGALAGEYVGASAEITAVYGAGANLLVGGGGPTFTLQPVSIPPQTGLNLALCVSQLELKSVEQ